MKALDAVGGALDTVGSGFFGAFGYVAAAARDVPVLKQVGGYVGSRVQAGWDLKIMQERVKAATKSVADLQKQGITEEALMVTLKGLDLEDEAETIIAEAKKRAQKARERQEKVIVTEATVITPEPA